MTLVRALVGALVVAVALVLQVTLFPHVAWQGIVPNLVLLVVAGAALTRGPQLGMLLGFVAGLALDLAPPADHVAGRWALALVLVGYVAGRVRHDSPGFAARPTTTAVVLAVAASSFVGTSVFALSGLLLGDLDVGIPGLLQVIAIGVLWDVLLTPFVMPWVMRLFTALQPRRVAL
jgi:rod shape-determining protein MreD